MVGTHLKELLSISGETLCNAEPKLTQHLIELAGTAAASLMELLGAKNGFYAFESALHVLPSNCLDKPSRIESEPTQNESGRLLSLDHSNQLASSPMDLERWNSDVFWRKEYGSATEGLLFFAEDVFGEQFALSKGSVWRFDSETGERAEFANSLDDWAQKILSDYCKETGYPLAHEWQVQNGPLEEGKRLVPKTPFIIGGKYETDNLFALDAVKAMRYRADLWKQIRDLPDGTPVQLKVIW